MRAYGPAVTIDGETMRCARCRHALGSIDAGYEVGAAAVEVAASTLGPEFADDERLRLRILTCPECGGCLKTSVGRDESDRVADARGLDPVAGGGR